MNSSTATTRRERSKPITGRDARSAVEMARDLVRQQPGLILRYATAHSMQQYTAAEALAGTIGDEVTQALLLLEAALHGQYGDLLDGPPAILRDDLQ